MKANKKVNSLVFNNFTNDSRVLKEAVSLRKNGFDVEVIAHLDSGLPEHEIQRGVKVKRVSFLDRKTTGIIGKIWAYIKYIVQAARVSKQADILHCNDLNTLPVALIVKLFYNKNIKVVYDAHEYETQMNNLSERGKKISAFFERWLIKYSDKTITVSASIAEEYKKLYPNIELPSLVLNCPHYKPAKKKNIFRKYFNLSKDTTLFLYQGSLSKGRGLEVIIDAFKQTENKKNTLIVMGYGNMEQYVKEQAEREENIFFHPAVSPDVLLNYTASADYGISTIENTCLSYYYCLPNKMFEYIMAGIPLIVSNLPEMKKVVELYDIGVVAEENTIKGILEAVEKASELDKKKLQANLAQAQKEYNWENQEKVLLGVYSSL